MFDFQPTEEPTGAARRSAGGAGRASKLFNAANQNPIISGAKRAAQAGKLAARGARAASAARRSGSGGAKEEKTSAEGGGNLLPPVEEAGQRVVERVEAIPVATSRVAVTAVGMVSNLTGQVAQFTGLLLLLYIVHSLFFWVDAAPDIAFERAALLLEVVEVVWDATAILFNAAVDIVNAGVIPFWNAGVYYVVEPSVVLVLEVFSLVFMEQHWEGVIDDATFPYSGLDCTATAEAAAWCGRYSFYEAKLLNTEYSNESVVLGPATARRLSELSGDGVFVTPAFDISFLTEALDDVATLLIALGAPIADTAASIFDLIFIKSAKSLFDLGFKLLRSLFDVFKMLAVGDMLTILIGVGVDYIVIYFLYWQLPIFFAQIDIVFCLIQLMMPSDWPEQLRCVDTTCFQGDAVQALGDVFVAFTSVPQTMKIFSNILDATLNGQTGRRFGGAGFPFAGDIKQLVGRFQAYPQSALDCAECFTCKFPEMRMVWWIVATTTSIVSSSYYGEFAGNVSSHCMDGGEIYAIF